MKCPKCNKEYNSMEEIIACLSKHVETEKANEQAKRDATKKKAWDNINEIFKELNSMIAEFNATYPETKIKCPMLTTEDKTHYSYKKKPEDPWKFCINGKDINDIDLDNLIKFIW